MSSNMPITASTKVAALLDHYPELEEVLIGIAPPFKKLRNPILRKSVAKVASIRQASAVARISVDDVVNKLRKAVGQPALGADESVQDATYLSSQPEWFDANKVVESLDERDVDPDLMPLNSLIERARQLQEAEIVELVTTYIPAPGIDIMKRKGFLFWAVEEPDTGLFKTYFSKPV